ncbi:MAG TPA: YdeI/OmpD-associated family protein [Vicinamibacterales bacterium]|nr:YdeI/OmpD-associated family protein [Vicinamibacterales bacterium]
MARKDPRVDAYIKKAAPFARPILTHLRKVVHRACPQVTETIKWGVPAFEYKGPFCGIAAFKAHAIFGFWKHGLLAKQGLLPEERTAMGSFGRITSLDDLPDETSLTRLIEAAAALNDAGVKAPRAARTPKPPIGVPPAFKAALARNRKTLAAFEAFSPSHRREYLEWITEARTEATRDKRIATALEWIAQGKSRNWKYQRT